MASIFLSYASEDRAYARSIGDALSGFGLEVWLDESELGGGDAWDQKIRKQIRECDYFMPIISARTEGRLEGYFRREWRLAVERTLDMADDHLFLVPVTIDDTQEARARVPEKFLQVQWLRLPDGRSTPALEAMCRRILSGGTDAPAAKKPAPRPKVVVSSKPYPPFPREEPGQRTRFWAHVLGWLVQSAWMTFQRLPRWVRIILYVWAIFFVVSNSRHHSSDDPSAEKIAKLNAIIRRHQGASDSADVARLGAQIAREFADEATQSSGHNPLLAIPFATPAGDAAATKLADAAFVQTYGRLAISRHGHVDLSQDSNPALDTKAVLARARDSHAKYVVYGTLESAGSTLTVTIAKVADGSIVWTGSYRTANADPAKIAADVDSKVPSPDDDDD